METRKFIRIESPCNRICTLDARGDYCIGCGRTPEEIRQWVAMSAEERTRIMAGLRDRLDKRKHGPA